MKKALTFALALVVLLTLCACGADSAAAQKSVTDWLDRMDFFG